MLICRRLLQNPVNVISQMSCADRPPNLRALVAKCDVNLCAQSLKSQVTLKQPNEKS